MVLVSMILFLKTFYPEEIDGFREKFKVEPGRNVTQMELYKKTNKTMLGYSFILFFVLVNVLPSLIIALNCNRWLISRIIAVPIAVLFSDIYICWYVFRKFILRSSSYCEVDND